MTSYLWHPKTTLNSDLDCLSIHDFLWKNPQASRGCWGWWRWWHFRAAAWGSQVCLNCCQLENTKIKAICQATTQNTKKNTGAWPQLWQFWVSAWLRGDSWVGWMGFFGCPTIGSLTFVNACPPRYGRYRHDDVMMIKLQTMVMILMQLWWFRLKMENPQIVMVSTHRLAKNMWHEYALWLVWKNTHVFFYLGVYQDLLAKNPVVSNSESASTGILIWDVARPHLEMYTHVHMFMPNHL